MAGPRASDTPAAPVAVDGASLARLIERIVKGVERGGREWTVARRKDSLQRVLAGSRSDAQLLQHRLTQLMAGWDSDKLDKDIELGEADTPAASPSAPPAEHPPQAARATPPPQPVPATTTTAGAAGAATAGPALAVALMPTIPPVVLEWARVVGRLDGTVRQGLPPSHGAEHPLGVALAALTRRLQAEGATSPLADEVDALCQRAAQVLQHRHHLVAQLGGLCNDLTDSLTDLAEDDSWAQGQGAAMRARLDEGLTARSVRSVSDLLRSTRERQGQLRQERARARDSLKTLINQMLSELGELGAQTGRFHDSVGRYADVIEKADSLESLAGVVREMVEESRTVHQLVQQTQARLQSEHTKAGVLNDRVLELESELRRLSDEVSTDPLTQIANRRGLMQAFEAEQSRLARGGGALAVGLIDIDNFKRLNDELGHNAGDEALKSLAQAVSQALRPTDHVARYGGEEFVVLLPQTPVEEGQQILTRLQRSVSSGLFMHENKKVLVTFSAGVTCYRDGERIEEALERADQALYEAKRTGKNRTCIG
jgi:diguanylate cyclase